MPNRLAGSSSPYLLQHANNPVDWRPWGAEAFAAARERGVPVFLSVGYSTCYWCHVMERESFEDQATADLLNRLFVPVKVDREQRPDVDDLYMAATQMMTGSGGWPMSVFIDPATLKPFWCGTYFPKEPAHGRPSFRQVLSGLSSAWTDQRDDVRNQADRLADAVEEHLASRAEPVALSGEIVASAVGALLRMFDDKQGGFGAAPKFPQPVYLEFLLDARGLVDADTRSVLDRAARFTLDRMAVGGLFDHAGGGFHRYCVDETWTVPHFEKMLYDNAQLASLYARAARLYDDPFYRRVVRRTLDYVLAEMTHGRGGFFSAQDAEVDHREGLNYLWTEPEAREALAPLGDDLLAFAVRVYGLDRTNFQDPHHPEDGPKTVLRLDDRPDRLANAIGLTEAEFLDRLDSVNAALLRARSGREQPHLDDKVLASWNGMMIAAMADGAELLDEPRYASAAARAMEFVLGAMRADDGRLRRAWREGVSDDHAVLEDYAYVIRALLRLGPAGLWPPESNAGPALPGDAVDLLDRAHADFGDADQGGYFDTRQGLADLFVRARTTYDGAVPSASGVMLHNLLDAADLDPGGDAESRWLADAVAGLRSLSTDVAERAVASVNATRGLLRVLTLDERVIERVNAGADPIEQRAQTTPGSSPQPVEVHASKAHALVKEGQPEQLELRLVVAPGRHILAAEPVAEDASHEVRRAAESLVPLRVGLVRGQGVAVYADYPEGEPYGRDLLGADELRVHTGELGFRVALEMAPGVGPTPGHPVLGVTFQACTDDACLEPTTVELGVKIELG